ncbi:unnamed protein product [Caenorhabditis auriculariae]|uniref:Uncharacterized protein n=1 Tax=Caenorhabditis auriculariae TaxID=2777116 RepID=A0A8S1GPA1_9PELO|nr:unnamed protein product [Caenorhabditis auriculariae]
MLAPIVTKDMRLFPAQKLPPCVKNVRSRAQSLDHFQDLQNSGSSRGRIIPVKPRTSASTGNLPSAGVARSPPKASVTRKTTLTAIQEGVEMTSHAIPSSRSESSSVTSAASTSSGTRRGRAEQRNGKVPQTASAPEPLENAEGSKKNSHQFQLAQSSVRCSIWFPFSLLIR